MRNQLFVIGGAVALWSALANPNWAQRSSGFDPAPLAWYASDIVVAEQQGHDARVLETWRGNLAPGTVLQDLDLPAMPLEVGPLEGEPPDPDGKTPRKTVGGKRVVLYLARRQAEEGMPQLEQKWTGVFHPVKFSAMWMAEDQAYVLGQREESVPQWLWPVKLPQQEPTEKNFKQQALDLLAAKKRLAAERAIADPAKRAAALRPLVTDSSMQRHEALSALANCGPAAVPVLKTMLRQNGRDAFQVAHALGRAARSNAGPEMTALLKNELAFWKKTAPGLPVGWWKVDVDHKAFVQFRNRAEILHAALVDIWRMDYGAARDVIVELHDFWTSLPEPEDEVGTANLRFEITSSCQRVLQVLDEPYPREARHRDGNHDDVKFTFPVRLPGNGSDIDLKLVDETNALKSTAAQIRFLTGLLPSTDAKDQTLTPRQCDALCLLGLTGSPEVASTIIDRLEFRGPGNSAILALSYLGMPAVEPLVAGLQTGSYSRNNLAILALREIKGKRFGRFACEIIDRQDLKLSESTVDMLFDLSVSDTED